MALLGIAGRQHRFRRHHAQFPLALEALGPQHIPAQVETARNRSMSAAGACKGACTAPWEKYMRNGLLGCDDLSSSTMRSAWSVRSSVK